MSYAVRIKLGLVMNCFEKFNSQKLVEFCDFLVKRVFLPYCKSKSELTNCFEFNEFAEFFFCNIFLPNDDVKEMLEVMKNPSYLVRNDLRIYQKKFVFVFLSDGSLFALVIAL